MTDIYPGITELRISDSSLALFRSCARKFEFRKIYCHNERDRSIHTDVGKAMHAAYQDWFVRRDREHALRVLIEEYPWDLVGTPNQPKSPEACYYTMEQLMDSDKMLEYDVAQIKCADGVVRPAIEVPFEIEIKGFELLPHRHVKIVYCGFIDLVLLSHLMLKYTTVDIKTDNDNKEDVSPKYKFKPQPLPYALVLQQALGDDIGDLEVNYLRVRVNIEDPKIQFYQFHKGMDDLKEWAFDLWCVLTQMSQYMQVGKWPRNGGDACMSYGGTCKFFSLCHERDPDAIREEIFLMNFTQDQFPEPWIKSELVLA